MPVNVRSSLNSLRVACWWKFAGEAKGRGLCEGSCQAIGCFAFRCHGQGEKPAVINRGLLVLTRERPGGISANHEPLITSCYGYCIQDPQTWLHEPNLTGFVRIRSVQLPPHATPASLNGQAGDIARVAPAILSYLAQSGAGDRSAFFGDVRMPFNTYCKP